MRHEFLPEARADLEDAGDWYEDQDPGLGSVFVARVRSTVHRLLDYPLSAMAIEGGCRWAPVTGFPYAVVYRVQGELLLIHAVWQAEQNPARLRDRLAPADDE